MGHSVANFRKPRLALLHSAGNDNAERLAMDGRHAAQLEDAVLPKCFEGIAKYQPFPLGGRVGSIEDQGDLGFEQTDGDAFALIAFDKLIRPAGTKDAVHPALQDCGRLAPPVWMDDDNAVGTGDLLAMQLHVGRKGGFLGNLRGGKNGVEFVGIQIMENDLMSIAAERRNGRLRNRMIEALQVGMSDDDGNLHDFEKEW